MSQKRYRELYDSDPVVVTVDGARYQCAGAVSADVVAETYRRQGRTVTVDPA
jgi:hypothetical protein